MVFQNISFTFTAVRNSEIFPEKRRCRRERDSNKPSTSLLETVVQWRLGETYVKFTFFRILQNSFRAGVDAAMGLDSWKRYVGAGREFWKRELSPHRRGL
jgi:hypothetical protein